MIHLALWLMSFAVVLFFAYALLLLLIRILSTKTGRDILVWLVVIVIILLGVSYYSSNTNSTKYSDCVTNQDGLNKDLPNNQLSQQQITNDCQQEYPTN